MNSRFIIPILVVGALAFACGPRPNEASTPSAAAVTQASTPKRQREPRPASIRQSMVVTRASNGVVHVSLTVANAGDRATELAFASGKTHDVAVLDERGREVWRWSAGKLFTQAVQTKALGGGDSVNFDESWKPRDLHGRYVVVATLESTNFPVEERAELVLP